MNTTLKFKTPYLLSRETETLSPILSVAKNPINKPFLSNFVIESADIYLPNH